jgi:hypothetical protein
MTARDVILLSLFGLFLLGAFAIYYQYREADCLEKGGDLYIPGRLLCLSPDGRVLR